MGPNPAYRTRGPYKKTAQRRTEILDAALNVFATEGYVRGSLRQIAAKVGMSDAGLLHHFGSKERLLAAVLQRRDELTGQNIDHELPGPLVLRQLINIAHANSANPGIIELFMTLSAEATVIDHPAYPYCQDRYERLQQRLLNVFVDIEERQWLVDSESPFSAALGTIAIWDGLQMQWLYRNKSFDIAVELETYLQTLLHYRIPSTPADMIGAK